MSRHQRLALVLIGSFAGLFVLAGVVGFLAGLASGVSGDSSDGPLLWGIGAFAVLAMIGSMVVSVYWMRNIDEAAREAHKSAWFWGGTGGMAAGGVLVILSSLPQAETLKLSAWFTSRTDPAAYMATGAFAMLTLMIVGYSLAWAWWWLARR
jgi:pheromone shutdown protein TraB